MIVRRDAARDRGHHRRVVVDVDAAAAWKYGVSATTAIF